MISPLNIVVMLGGPSAEREVSFSTGKAVADALRSLGHDVSEFDPRGFDWILSKKADVVFLALHGTYGEDGTVQQRLERLQIPYTGSGVRTSQIAFDKVISKKIFIQKKIPTPRFIVLNVETNNFPKEWKVPVVMKPVRQGSSVGLFFVHKKSEFEEALKKSLKFDKEVLMEEKINGKELTVGILDGKPLPIIEIRPKKGAYDYHNKYTKGATEYICPAPFHSRTTKKIQQIALKAYNALGCRDYARVDILLDKKNKPFVLEVNTLPGMTATSLLPKAAAAKGISYEMLCQQMVELALKRKKVKK